VGGRAYPYNDYDIYVISDNRLAESEVEKVANLSAERIGRVGITSFNSFKKKEQKFDKNFYVDIKCLAEKDLKNVLPRLRYYKFREVTQVLYGDDMRETVPNYILSEIPLSEAGKFLLDRMSQLVEYYSTKGEYCDEFLTYIIQQAYAACCTSLLMLSGNYKPKYSESSAILLKTYKKDFVRLHKRIPDLATKVKILIDWKLNPSDLPFRDVENAWFICAQDITEVTKYFFSEFLGKKLNNLDDLSNAIISMFSKFYIPYLKIYSKHEFKVTFLAYPALPLLNLFFKYKYLLRLRGVRKVTLFRVLFNRTSPDLIIFSSVPYILNTLISSSEENEKNKSKAIRLLRKVYPTSQKPWEELTLDYANAYIAFFR